jgi:hypothetical protein
MVALFVATAIAQWAVPGSLIWKSERILAEGKPFRFHIRPVDPADLFRGRYVAIGVERGTVDLDRMHAEGEFRPGTVMYASLAVDAAGFAYPAALTPAPPKGADVVRVRVGWGNRQPGVAAEDILDAQTLLARIRSEEDPICADLRRLELRHYRDDQVATEEQRRRALALLLSNAVSRMVVEPGPGAPSESHEQQWRRALETLTGHFPSLIRTTPRVRVSVEYPFSRYYAGEKSAPRLERAVADPQILRQSETWVTVRVLGSDALIEDLFIAGKPAREYLVGSK